MNDRTQGDNPIFAEIQRQLLSHLQAVNYPMPADQGDLRTIVSQAFLCGAAIVLEMGETGAGRACVEYAATLTKRRQGMREMLQMGGRIIQ